MTQNSPDPSHRAERIFRSGILALRAALFVFAAALAGASHAEEWKTATVRDLVFAVPAKWHFMYEPDVGVVAYTPDARVAAGAPLGITILPGRFGDLIPTDAILDTRQITLGGRMAKEYEVRLPSGGILNGRMIDFDDPSADGRPIGIAMISSAEEADALLAVYSHFLESLRFDGDISTFIVPELAGPWYFDGRPGRTAQAISREQGAYYSVDPDVNAIGDERIEVVRLGPLDLLVVSGAPSQQGKVDVAGSRIDWADGTYWSRVPSADGSQE
ncbi:MAG: hypothetical protein F9K19_14485 [Rhizobiaceae bacterium]|nr:MAG: hypothetical protein F9K19_14485 [Rhizobiaceae bacterium]CAG1014844.1 hypothetical protein RHIZO_04898 [Rhizobiaceae bacterium]